MNADDRIHRLGKTLDTQGHQGAVIAMRYGGNAPIINRKEFIIEVQFRLQNRVQHRS